MEALRGVPTSHLQRTEPPSSCPRCNTIHIVKDASTESGGASEAPENMVPGTPIFPGKENGLLVSSLQTIEDTCLERFQDERPHIAIFHQDFLIRRKRVQSAFCEHNSNRNSECSGYRR